MTSGTVTIYARTIYRRPRRLIDRLLRRNRRTQLVALWPSGRRQVLGTSGPQR